MHEALQEDDATSSEAESEGQPDIIAASDAADDDRMSDIQVLGSEGSESSEAAEAEEESDSEEDPVQAEASAKLRRYVQQLTGKKVRDAGLQTGGPGAKVGKKVGGKRKHCSVTQADAISKMRMALPLLESLSARPYLRDLLANYMAHATAYAGVPLLAPKGGQVVPVSTNRMSAERKVLE